MRICAFKSLKTSKTPVFEHVSASVSVTVKDQGDIKAEEAPVQAAAIDDYVPTITIEAPTPSNLSDSFFDLNRLVKR